MALVLVGYAIPEQGIVTYRCERRERHVIRHRIKMAHTTGGMPKVERYLSRHTSESGITTDREN